MPYLTTWDDFEKAAERLYLADPMKTRCTMKYTHQKGNLIMKVTDDATCVMYKAEYSNDIKKMEKFVSNLMRHMASKEQS